EAFGSERLAASPRARIADYFLDAIVNRDRTGICFHRETPAYIAMGDTVTVPVELNAQILVDQGVDSVAIVIGDDGQRPQRLCLKAIHRPLTSFTMQALIGDFCQPLPNLAIDIVEIAEFAQGPEVLPDITDGAFDLALFPTTGRIAGSRVETKF